VVAGDNDGRCAIAAAVASELAHRPVAGGARRVTPSDRRPVFVEVLHIGVIVTKV